MAEVLLFSQKMLTLFLFYIRVSTHVRFERRTNPFVRALDLDAGIVEGLGTTVEDINNPISLLAAVRKAKNQFK